MFEPDEAVSRNKYEILKIWVPTHGVVNVYRKPGSLAGTSALEGLLMQCARRPVLIEKFFFFTEYHVDNGFLIGKPVHGHRLEKIRVLASHGSVITIERDSKVSDLQNKYTVDPASLAVDQSEVWVDDPK